MSLVKLGTSQGYMQLITYPPAKPGVSSNQLLKPKRFLYTLNLAKELYMYNVMLIWWRTPRSMLWPHPPPNKGRGCYKLVRVTLALIVLSACILVPVLFPFQEVLCRRTRRAGITCRRVVQSLCSYKAFSEPPLLFS